MPRILRIINRFNLGGPSYNAALLSKYLPSEFETCLIGGVHEDDETSSMHIMNELGLKPQVIYSMRRAINLKQDIAAYLEIKRIIKEFQPDIIHTHASKAGAIGRLAALNNPNIKLVHTFHGHVFHSYFGKLKTNIYKSIERFLAKKSSKIIAISEEQKRELTEIYQVCKKDKVVVVPLGFNLEKFQQNRKEKRNQFRKNYGIKEEEVAIGIVGRISAIKNHFLFLQAFKKAKELSQHQLKAIIIGDGELKESLYEECERLGLTYTSKIREKEKTADVLFTSWILDMEKVYPGLDIVALSSLNEGTPVSLIEAQAANVPVISTNVGGVKNCMLDQKTGLIVPSNNLNAFSDAILNITENDDLKKQLSTYSWDYVKEKYHYKRLVQDMEKIYREILSPAS